MRKLVIVFTMQGGLVRGLSVCWVVAFLMGGGGVALGAAQPEAPPVSLFFDARGQALQVGHRAMTLGGEVGVITEIVDLGEQIEISGYQGHKQTLGTILLGSRAKLDPTGVLRVNDRITKDHHQCWHFSLGLVMLDEEPVVTAIRRAYRGTLDVRSASSGRKRLRVFSSQAKEAVFKSIPRLGQIEIGSRVTVKGHDGVVNEVFSHGMARVWLDDGSFKLYALAK